MLRQFLLSKWFLIVLLLLVPLLEITVFVLAAKSIGLSLTLILAFVSTVIGLLLCRSWWRQVVADSQLIRDKQGLVHLPADIVLLSFTNVASCIGAAVCFVAPGFITDFCGYLMLNAKLRKQTTHLLGVWVDAVSEGQKKTFQASVIEVGSVLSQRYKVVRELGSGPSAMLYLCDNQYRSGEQVVVKLFYREIHETTGLLAQIKQSIRYFLALDHPNLLKVHRLATHEKLDYYAMEFMDDGDLTSRIDNPVSVSETAKILAQVASALSYLHQRDIIHRNVKAESILFSKTGDVKLAESVVALDSNAVANHYLTVIGSLEHFSPEYLERGELSFLSDVYALGCVAYEFLTGKLPFAGNSVIESMTMRLKSTPVAPKELRVDCPQEFSDLILKAKAIDSKDRFQTAAEMQKALEGVVAETC